VIVGASYEGDVVTLHHDSGEREEVPFTPRMLVPGSLAPYLPHHLETVDAPGGLYVEAPYTTLLKLYQRLSRLTNAIVFPPPERQFLLLNNLRPFSEGLRPNLPTPLSALYHLLRTTSTPNPALTFLENTLFLHGYARPLKRISRISVDHRVYFPLFQFNVDSSSFSEEGILLPTSPVRVRTFREIHSVHPRIGRRVLKGEGVITLADALLYNLPHELIKELRSSPVPSFLLREVESLVQLFLSSYRSSPRDLLVEDPTAYNLLLTSSSILLSLPDLLVNTFALGMRGRNTLLALYNLLRRDPNLYNDLAPSIDTCCPALSALASYLPALSSLLTEPLR